MAGCLPQHGSAVPVQADPIPGQVFPHHFRPAIHGLQEKIPAALSVSKKFFRHAEGCFFELQEVQKTV